MKQLITSIFLAMLLTTYSQQEVQLPYAQIPDHPQTYTAETVAARMVDGLGFRYYWATEGLRPEDLTYKPGSDARTSFETIQHIYSLVEVLHNAVHGVPTERSGEAQEMSFDEMRAQTLIMIKEASDILRNAESGTLENAPMVFKRGDNTTEFPFWNLINGPIEDAVWHVGQVVSMRRGSGNPFNSKVNVLTGSVRQ